MSQYVVKTAIRKLLGKKLQEKFGQGDPYYERVPKKGRDGKPTGKLVKQKRVAPPGLSDHDLRVLHKVRKRVHRLDWSLFTIMGVGFGWSTVIGIIPGIGDAIDGMMSLSVFRKCCDVEGGLPLSVKLQMAINVVLDFVIGLVPGAEALYRGNTRNALLLEDFLRKKGEATLNRHGDRADIGARRDEPSYNRGHSEQSNGIDDAPRDRRPAKRR